MFIHSLVGGHLGYFHFLAIMNRTALNIPIYVFWCTHVHLCLGLPGSPVAGHRAGMWLVAVGSPNFPK